MEAAVVQIGGGGGDATGTGGETFEITNHRFYWNGTSMDMSSITTHPVVTPFANDLSIRYKRIKGNNNLEANIYLGRGHDKIELKTSHKEEGYVKVQLDIAVTNTNNPSKKNEASYQDYYRGSYGLLGRVPDGAKVGRDGVTIITNANDFGREWQVLPEEPKLFHTYDHPWVVPAGQQCKMPVTAEPQLLLRKRRRLTPS